MPFNQKRMTLYEDQLPEDYPYDEAFPLSQVILGVRMFPEITVMESTIQETNAVVEHVRVAGGGKSERPRPEWIRGKCPECGDDLVSNCYWIGGRGYQIRWECWSSLSMVPTCNYAHVLE